MADVLPFAGHLALVQRSQNAERAEQPGAQVCDRNADTHRTLPRQPGDRHQPAHALRDLVEARAVLVRPVLAETGDAAEHYALVDLPEVFVVDAKPAFHVGPEVLDHDVGLLDHLEQRRAARGILQVYCDAALVAVQILEVGTLARPAHPLAALFVRRHLDLDDIGAPIGQLPHAGGAGPHAGQIEHGKARKRLGGLRKWHGFRFSTVTRTRSGQSPIRAMLSMVPGLVRARASCSPACRSRTLSTHAANGSDMQ